MATATLDITVAPPFTDSTQRRQIAAYNGPAVYDVNGDPFSPESVRMGKIFTVLAGVAIDGATVYLLYYSPPDGVMFWLTAADALPVTPGTNLMGALAYVEVIGQ